MFCPPQTLVQGDIHALPDDILISIISRLTLREATATSILCHRWRYLHTYVTRLDFPPFTSELEVGSFSISSRSNHRLIESETRRFGKHVKMIDRVLDSHRGGVGVKELKMHMHRLQGATASVKKWVQFAFTKEIEIIDIRLQVLPTRRYSLGLSKITRQIQSLKFLKHLSLDGFNMNDRDFELLFSKSNFVALESASIRGMNELTRVSIVGHPKLKHVDIRFTSTPLPESFEIRDMISLVSLCFDSLPLACAIKLENIPNLREFYYGDGYCRSDLTHVDLFAGNGISSCILHQLQLLHISTIDYLESRLQQSSFWELPYKFVNLKYMELEVKRISKPTLWRHAYLIQACPLLQKLKIKFCWYLYDGLHLIKSGERKAIVYEPYQKKWCPNLKELELEGYAGSQSEFKLASDIINCAPNLEQVIVLPNDATHYVLRETTARAKSDFQKLAPPQQLHVIFK